MHLRDDWKTLERREDTENASLVFLCKVQGGEKVGKAVEAAWRPPRRAMPIPGLREQPLSAECVFLCPGS